MELLDSASIIPGVEPTTGAHIWIQFPEDPLLRRILLDVQVIHISYSTQSDMNETSYIEGLIRPYNQLKIIEQTKIMFNMANAQTYQKFTIPIKGMSRQKAEEQIGQLIQDYSEEIEFDDTLGTINVNGSGSLILSGGTVTLATTGWGITNGGTLTFSGLTVSETPTVQPSSSFSVRSV